MPINQLLLTFQDYQSESQFPATGTANVIYTVTGTDVAKYWDGVVYQIYIGPRVHH